MTATCSVKHAMRKSCCEDVMYYLRVYWSGHGAMGQLFLGVLIAPVAEAISTRLTDPFHFVSNFYLEHLTRRDKSVKVRVDYLDVSTLTSSHLRWHHVVGSRRSSKPLCSPTMKAFSSAKKKGTTTVSGPPFSRSGKNVGQSLWKAH